MTTALHANGGDLTIARMRHIGLVKTQSQNRYITDSAASGTAYATGHKTNNGSLGVDSEGNVLSNMTEYFLQKGMLQVLLRPIRFRELRRLLSIRISPGEA